MRNLHFFTKTGIGLFSLLLIAVAGLAILTHANRNISNPNPLIHFSIQNNAVIMVVLIIMSITYGFLWSNILYREVKQKKQESRSILQTVFLFLGNDEQSIIQFLVQHRGQTTQADISRLPGMTRVKAFRSLQKMQEKNLVEIIAHGKIRRVNLKENIMNSLSE